MQPTVYTYLFRYLFPLLSSSSSSSPSLVLLHVQYTARILADLERAARNRCLQLPPRNILLKDWPLRTRTIRRCFHVRDHGPPPLPRVNLVPAFVSTRDLARFSYPFPTGDPTGIFDLAEYFFFFRREEKGGDFGARRRCLGTI